MTTPEIIALASAIVASISATSAVLSARTSMKALGLSRKVFEETSELTKRTFKRQGVINLHLAWRDVGDIKTTPEEIIPEDVRQCVNALDLTSSLWNHDVIEKEILFQSYWPPYKKIFDKLDRIEFVIPDLDATGKALLTKEMRLAYKQMMDRELGSATQTTV